MRFSNTYLNVIYRLLVGNSKVDPIVVEVNCLKDGRNCSNHFSSGPRFFLSHPKSVGSPFARSLIKRLPLSSLFEISSSTSLPDLFQYLLRSEKYGRPEGELLSSYSGGSN